MIDRVMLYRKILDGYKINRILDVGSGKQPLKRYFPNVFSIDLRELADLKNRY